MKKFLLSAFVIAVFAIYVLNLRNQITITSSPNNNNSALNPSPANGGSVSKKYKDGEYIGNVADAYYGNVQIGALIKNGKIVDVRFLDYPKDRRTSVEINSRAMPALKSEAIQAQSSGVDIVSGATQTSEAFIESLSSILAQAKI